MPLNQFLTGTAPRRSSISPLCAASRSWSACSLVRQALTFRWLPSGREEAHTSLSAAGLAEASGFDDAPAAGASSDVSGVAAAPESGELDGCVSAADARHVGVTPKASVIRTAVRAGFTFLSLGTHVA